MSFIIRRTEEFSFSIADGVHRLEDRQTGAEERGDLAGQVHHAPRA